MSTELQRLTASDSGDRLDLRFARPEARNALDHLAWDEIDGVMGTAAERDDLRVITLTGEGTAFCAGVDFEAIEQALKVEYGRYPSFVRKWAGVADRFERAAPPTIAAVNGPAIGAGFEIALACDLRIASDRATFCMPQMRMGIVPDAGGTSRLARATGAAFAKDVILSARVVDAEEALRAGIVSRVVPHERLADEVDELAQAIAGLPWPSAFFANLAIDAGPQLDPRRAADLESVADQVMLREDAMWSRVEGFTRGGERRG